MLVTKKDESTLVCVRSASTHMAAMCLWRPPNGPGGPGLPATSVPDALHVIRARPVSNQLFS